MNLRLFIFLFVVFVYIQGCDSPRINTTSDELMKKSMDKVRNSLPDNKKSAYDTAIQTLTYSQIDLNSIFVGQQGANNIENKVKSALNGKTGLEVISEAERILNERKKEERRQALSEIKELEEKHIAAEKAKEELVKFQIIKSRFYKEEQAYIGSQPTIELSVKNGTNLAVSRAYFEGTLASPGRSVPWMKDTFNYQISGGLEPGEEATWKLAPNMFSNWGRTDVPTDAIFTVKVEQLDGADGKSLYSIREFTENDAERLNKLKKEYSNSK